MKFFKFLRGFFKNILRILNIIGEYVKYRRYIKEELRNTPTKRLSKKQINEFKKYYKSYGFTNLRDYWHQYYSGFGIGFSKEIMPQDLFFAHVEGSLNDYRFYYLQDKNLLDKLLNGFKQPNTILKNINGFYLVDGKVVPFDYAVKLLYNCCDIIIKPSIETGGGKGVKKLSIKNGITSIDGIKVEDLLKSYKENFLIQEAVIQSDIINKLNPSSLNTIRIATYINENEVGVLFSIIRIGGVGEFKDNISTGGFYAAIKDWGNLDKYGYNSLKEKITQTSEGTILENFKIPNYQEVTNFVKKMHVQLPYFKVISWDIAINNFNEPVVIEFNSFGQSIDFQTVCGPFFGKYTNEVLDIVQKKIN